MNAARPALTPEDLERVAGVVVGTVRAPGRLWKTRENLARKIIGRDALPLVVATHREHEPLVLLPLSGGSCEILGRLLALASEIKARETSLEKRRKA